MTGKQGGFGGKDGRTEFAKALAPLLVAIGKRLEHAQLEVYFAMLSDLTVEQLRTAVARALCEHEFSTVPSIATLRRLAVERDGSDAIVKASEMVLASRKYAFYEPDRARKLITDPKAMQAMESIGGMGRLADLTPDTIGTYAAQFRNAYQALSDAGKVSDVRKGLGLNPGQKAITSLVRNLEHRMEQA